MQKKEQLQKPKPIDIESSPDQLEEKILLLVEMEQRFQEIGEMLRLDLAVVKLKKGKDGKIKEVRVKDKESGEVIFYESFKDFGKQYNPPEINEED